MELLIGPRGCGKTTWLSHHCFALALSPAPPPTVLIIAFSRPAADHVRWALADLCRIRQVPCVRIKSAPSAVRVATTRFDFSGGYAAQVGQVRPTVLMVDGLIDLLCAPHSLGAAVLRRVVGGHIRPKTLFVSSAAAPISAELIALAAHAEVRDDPDTRDPGERRMSDTCRRIAVTQALASLRIGNPVCGG